MSSKQRIKTAKGCVTLCKQQIDAIQGEISNLKYDISESESDTEILDSIIAVVYRIERHCNNIKSYCSECSEY